VGHCLLDCVLYLVLLLFLGARYVLLVLNFIPSTCQIDHVLLAISQVEKYTRRTFRNRHLCLCLDSFMNVMLGADKFPRIAKALPSVGHVERGGMAVEGIIRVARFLFNCLQHCALELRAFQATTKIAIILHIWIQPFLEPFPDVLDIFILPLRFEQTAVLGRKRCSRSCVDAGSYFLCRLGSPGSSCWPVSGGAGRRCYIRPFFRHDDLKVGVAAPRSCWSFSTTSSCSTGGSSTCGRRYFFGYRGNLLNFALFGGDSDC